MASGFFGLLANGASFSGRADVAAFKQQQKRASSGAFRRLPRPLAPSGALWSPRDPLTAILALSRRFAGPAATPAPDADELDFFGFNAAAYEPLVVDFGPGQAS